MEHTSNNLFNKKAIEKLNQIKMEVDELYNKHNTEDLFKKFTDSLSKESKKTMEPILCRIEFNKAHKCQTNNCYKIASHKNMLNDTLICWFHAYTLEGSNDVSNDGLNKVKC